MSILKKTRYLLLYIPLVVFSASSLSAQEPPAREYQIKAVFLFNFTQFVEWPVQALPEAGSPLVIGILGDDPAFSAYLKEVVAGEKVLGHPLVIKIFEDIKAIKKCHILFISKTESHKLKRIMASLRGRSILTVSDADNFMGYGGMIRFVTLDKKVRFQINPDVAKAAELNISSKLLSLAEIISLKKKQ